MIHLGVNIDHIATIRQARRTYEPDPVNAVLLAELGGADGVTVHLREDRRHIQERDVYLLKEVVQGKFNLEMANHNNIVELALKIKPDQVTIVPEKREEVTTEGGLDCRVDAEQLEYHISLFEKNNIEVSLFIDPDLAQVDMAKKLGAHRVEFHTGSFANSFYISRGGQKPQRGNWIKEKERLFLAAHKANKIGLDVSAGHGINYQNVGELLAMPHLSEMNIGHAIIARSVFTGLKQAVADMKALLQTTSK